MSFSSFFEPGILLICAPCGSPICVVNLSGPRPTWHPLNPEGPTVTVEEFLAAPETRTAYPSMPDCPKCGPIELKAGALRKAKGDGKTIRAYPKRPLC